MFNILQPQRAGLSSPRHTLRTASADSAAAISEEWSISGPEGRGYLPVGPEQIPSTLDR